MHPLKRIHLSLCYVIFLSDKEIEITAFDQKKIQSVSCIENFIYINFLPQKARIFIIP